MEHDTAVTRWNLPVVVLFLCAIVLAVLPFRLVSATSNITAALYRGTVTISNNSTATTSVVSNITNISTSGMISAGYINATANNTAMRDAADADIAFMPGANTTAWYTWDPTVLANSYTNYHLYAGGVTGGKYRYFPGTAGMTTADSATLEPASNYTIEVSGYFDLTGIGSGSTSYPIVTKKPADAANDEAFRIQAAETGSIVAQQYGWLITSESTAVGAGVDSVWGVNWLAQTFNATNNYRIASVELSYNGGGGNPGDLVVSLRATAAGVPTGPDLATFTEAQANITASGAGWKVFHLPPISLSSNTTYALVARAPAGTGADWYDLDRGAAYGSGQIYTSADSGATWGPVAADSAFRINRVLPALEATGITTGEHIIKVTNDGALASLYVDGILKSIGATAGSGIPDNAASWTWYQASTARYADYASITIGGNSRQYIAWQLTNSVFTDTTGSGHDATPSWPTGSSDPDVTGVLVSFLPVEESEAPPYSISSPPGWITAPNLTGAFSSNVTPTFPGADIIQAIATASSTPAQLPFLMIFGFFILTASVTTSWAIKKFATSGSLLLKLFLIVVLMGFGTAVRVFDVWMVVFFILIAAALGMMSQHKGWA